MFVVIVFFAARAGHVAEFHDAIKVNAKASVDNEPGCRQFDVAHDPNDPTQFFLYEIYDDEAAFKAHLETAHFAHFETISAPWTADKKVMTFKRIAANLA